MIVLVFCWFFVHYHNTSNLIQTIFSGRGLYHKRPKFDQETKGKVNEETYPDERCRKDQEQYLDASTKKC